MLEKAPQDAPWRAMVQGALTRVGSSTAPALSDDAMAAANGMTANDREAMIRGMVERLAARLEQQPDDKEGWARLAHAYDVLGEADKAKAARARAGAVGAPVEASPPAR
jgi:cytochrome c-type biogenesis protein CcmH